jgi:hypothetical protein
MKTLKEKVEDMLGEYENVLLADGFDDAFVGIGRQFGKPFAIYERSKCIDILKKDMSEEESEEYFQFNVEGAWVGKNTPIFLEKIY